MEYRIVTCSGEPLDSTGELLAQGVGAWIARGWRPCGGVSVSVSIYPAGDGLGEMQWIVMAQAMTKREEQD